MNKGKIKYIEDTQTTLFDSFEEAICNNGKAALQVAIEVWNEKEHKWDIIEENKS